MNEKESQLRPAWVSDGLRLDLIEAAIGSVDAPDGVWADMGWLIDQLRAARRDNQEAIGAVVFLCIHHTEQRKEAEQSARIYADRPKTKANKATVAACRRVAAHHSEQLYLAGELAARLGGRNGYPRPSSSAVESPGTEP